MIVFKNKLKDKLISLVDKLGYRIINKKHLLPIDQRELANDPKALKYFTTTDRQIIIEGYLKDGRGLEIFSLDSESSHPFIYAIKEAKNSNEPKKTIREILNKYYFAVEPKNTAEWLGLNQNEVPLLDSEPAWLSLLPWENTDIARKKQARQECAIYDNKEHEKAYPIEKGWRNFGPVSNEILEIETNRLFKLMQSIENKGYLRDDSHGGDIGAIVLINEKNKWRWLVEWGGQHRAAVVAAMGYEKIPIKVWQVIERKDVQVWPCVQSGIYTKESALKVFDNIFDANSEKFMYKDWINR